MTYDRPLIRSVSEPDEITDTVSITRVVVSSDRQPFTSETVWELECSDCDWTEVIDGGYAEPAARARGYYHVCHVAVYDWAKEAS